MTAESNLFPASGKFEIEFILRDIDLNGLTGRRLGPYEIQARIGLGGMGEVYRAHDTKLGRAVAIKILPRHFTSDRDRVARF